MNRRGAHILVLILAAIDWSACDAVTGPMPLPVDTSGVETTDTTQTTEGEDDVGSPLPERILAQIDGGNAMGAAGRTEHVTVSCAGEPGLEWVVWTVSGESHRVEADTTNGPWAAFSMDVEVPVDRPNRVHVACSNTDKRVRSASRLYTAPPPPGLTQRDLAAVQPGDTIRVALEPDPMTSTTFSVLSFANASDVHIRHDTLFAVAGSRIGGIVFRLDKMTAFGSGIYTLTGSVGNPGRLVIWTNTDSRISLFDSGGRLVRTYEQGPRVRSFFPERGLETVVSVRVTAQDGNHFSVQRPFRAPAPGKTTILNAYQVSMQPCREFEAAWGIELTTCRDLLAATLFEGGYQRYDRRPEAIMVGHNPVSGTRLRADWEYILEEARLDWEGRGAYMTRLPGRLDMPLTRFRQLDGYMDLVPAETGRILFIPDPRATELEVKYVSTSTGYLVGAAVVVPTSQEPGPSLGDVSDVVFRAWYPFTSSAALESLPPVRRSHFLATVVAAIRSAEDGISGLNPGDRAQDVLILP